MMLALFEFISVLIMRTLRAWVYAFDYDFASALAVNGMFVSVVL